MQMKPPGTPPSLFDTLIAEQSVEPAAADAQPVSEDIQTPTPESGDTDSHLFAQDIQNHQYDSDVQMNDPLNQHRTVTTMRGRLLEAERAALIYLLKKGVILHRQKPAFFDAVVARESHIRERLADMNLMLTVDERGGMLFIRQIGEADLIEDDEEIGDNPSLISSRKLTLYDSLILLILRRHFQVREAAGETTVIIDIDRLENELKPFLAISNSSRQDRKKLNGVIKRMINKNLMITVRNNEDRWEISPIIRHVVNAEFLERLWNEYLILANSDAFAGSDDHD